MTGGMCFGFLIFCCGALAAGPIQLVSPADPSLGTCATAGGDSYVPIMTPDGRFVFFGSTAANLVQLGTNGPIPAVIPTPINVFLRNRLNGSTALVSVNTNGSGGGDADSVPTGVSTNGRYALFEGSASTLVLGDTNTAGDVFLRDVVSATTLLVSAGTNGSSADDSSYSSVMTPDGRFVAFASAADNLVAGDTNGIPDVFVRDLASNVTTLVSVGAGGSVLLNTSSDGPVITPDGRYVAFYSTATNLVPGVATFGDVYLRDLKTATTTWISSGALAALQSIMTATNSVSFSPALSSDGRYVAYEATQYPLQSPAVSVVLRYDLQTGKTEVIDTNAPGPSGLYNYAQDLAVTPDGRFVAYVANAIDTSGATTAIRLWDGQTGTNLLVSANSTNGVSAGSLSDSPVIDDTGRFVAFLSSAPDLVTNQLQDDFHLYLSDLQKGTITLVDANTNGVGAGIDPATTPSISADGRFVAFDSPDNSLVPFDRNHAYDVFVRDLAGESTELVSSHDPALSCVTADGSSLNTGISASFDGSLVAFWSVADDLTLNALNDTNGLRDIYVRDLKAGTNLLISINTNGVAGDGLSTDPTISADGNHLAFTSYADDLVSGDTNQAQDVFVVALPQGKPALVSVNAAGTGPGNADSFSPTISSNGQFVLFHSRATNLAPVGKAGVENLFWRDLQAGATYALTSNGVTAASMTPDGTQVAFITSSIFNQFSPLWDRLYVWDSHSSSVSYSLAGVGFQSVNISPDGQRIAYTTNNGAGGMQLSVLDRALGTNWIINAYSSVPTAAFSADGRFLVYVAGIGLSPGDIQVYLFDLQTQTNLLVSVAYDGSGAGNDNSDSVGISPDGRFVCYRSAATNLVPGDNNGEPDVFLYDRVGGTTTLVSSSRLGGTSANNRSLNPVFSGDGRTLVFTSWASDLIAGDFNNASDVFTVDLNAAQDAPLEVKALGGSGNSPPGNWLAWPASPGKSYRVEFKTNLTDPVWQPLSGPISIMGGQASFNDGTAGGSSRFYRVVAY